MSGRKCCVPPTVSTGVLETLLDDMVAKMSHVNGSTTADWNTTEDELEAMIRGFVNAPVEKLEYQIECVVTRTMAVVESG